MSGSFPFYRHELWPLMCTPVCVRHALFSLYRFRSCQLVGKMLMCAVERNCQLDSEVLETVEASMLERINDKVGKVVVWLWSRLLVLLVVL